MRTDRLNLRDPGAPQRAPQGNAAPEVLRPGMEPQTFATRVDEVDRRIREIQSALAGEIGRKDGAAQSTTWERGGSWATLTLHDGKWPRLELSLHNGRDEHPEALEIGIDDADVVNMIAVPVADLLARAS